MNIFRKIGFIAITLVALLALSACMQMNTTGPGGGDVFVDGVLVSGGDAVAPPAAQQTGGEAQQQQQQDQGFFGNMTLFVPIILMFAVMWLLVIRPQRKQAKAAKEMQEALGVGENVMTTSGFFGKIVGVGTDAFLVEFGEGKGIRIWIRKTDISGIRIPVTTTPPSDAK